MEKRKEKIDFVVTWVDGNDPEWYSQMLQTRKSFQSGKYEMAGSHINAEHRYRDLGLLRYWFRGVEQFAPWVNKIYFVTCGQKPEWLNANHPKLVLVNHEDYIPHEWLPTFNSDVIELNLHRISELSEYFVLFNDDTFLLRPVNPEFYFKNSLPVLPSNLNIGRYFRNDSDGRKIFNMSAIINEHFDVISSIKKNKDKWFGLGKLGVKIAVRNFLCYKINKIMPVWHYEHLPMPHLKSTFQEVWDEYPEFMADVSRAAFRPKSGGVNHWLIAGWNTAKGLFSPVRLNVRGEIKYNLSDENTRDFCRCIEKQSLPQICLTDVGNDNLDECFNKIGKAFEQILPEASSFEL